MKYNMNEEKTTFAAIFKDGNFIQKDSVDEVTRLENALFNLRIEFHHKHTTQFGNTYYYYWFKIIDSTYKKENSIFGNFEIVDIGHERGTWENDGMIFKIIDLNKMTVHDFSTKLNGLQVFEKEIFPLMKKLNELGSWDNYIIFEKNTSNEKKIIKLKARIELLENNISNLEEDYISLKSEIVKLIKDNLPLFQSDLEDIMKNKDNTNSKM
jgi:hypothetical protein